MSKWIHTQDMVQRLKMVRPHVFKMFGGLEGLEMFGTVMLISFCSCWLRSFVRLIIAIDTW